MGFCILAFPHSWHTLRHLSQAFLKHYISINIVAQNKETKEQKKKGLELMKVVCGKSE